MSGALLPSRTSLWLLSAVWTSERTRGQSFHGVLNSDNNALIVRVISRHTTSTVPFDHGQYGCVKWCEMCNLEQRSRMTSFLKCVPRSLIHRSQNPKATIQSIRESAVVLA